MNKSTKVLINLVIIFLITAAILYGFFGVKEEDRLKLKLGLDLRSGTHITLQLTPVEDPQTHEVKKIDQAVLDRSIQVFTKRLNSAGTSEVLISSAGTDRIIIEIPDNTNLEQAKNLVKKTGDVIFRNEDGTEYRRFDGVEYGEAVTAPAVPAKEYDDTYHYTDARWDTDYPIVKDPETVITALQYPEFWRVERKRRDYGSLHGESYLG